MWPDVADVKQALKLFPEPRSNALGIWPDVVLSAQFLVQAVPYCSDLGRNKFITSSELKSIVESFVGRGISEFAVRVAVRMGGVSLQVKPSKRDSSVLLVKVPPLDKFEQARDVWKQHQEVWEQAIKEERMEMAQWKAKFGKEMYE